VTARTRTAAIIAGGQARRFGGRDKARLLVDGRPIIIRQVEILQRVADPVLVIGGPPARFADLPVVVQADLIPGAGAMGGVYTALVSAPGDLVLVVAADLPYLDAPVLARLADMAAGADAAWVRTHAGPEPLIACYQRAIADRLRAAIAAGRLKLADLAAVLDVVELTGAELARYGDPARLVTNVNTLHDYERIQ
jgi:molybdopterin-guanine dinucleotide biosynthesis protein A